MLNRRQFIVKTLQSAIATGLAGCAFSESTAENILVGGGQFIEAGKAQFVISTVKYDSLSLSLSPTEFLPHGFHRKPDQPNILSVFEKKGPGAVLFDIDKNSVLQTITPQPGRHFYGHGAYTVDNKFLFSTETILATREGVIGVRDANSMAYLGEFPSFGWEPHECKLVDNGATLVVTNGGGSLGASVPCVSYIDIQSKQLIEKVELTNSKLNTGHLAISANGDLVVVSAPRAGLGPEHLGGVSIRKRGGKMLSMAEPLDVANKMYGEALSVEIQSAKGIVAVTHPGGNMLSFWSLADASLLKVIELESPRGVSLSLDETQFIVSYGSSASLARIDINTLNLVPESILMSSYLSGSHIYNWSRAMSEIGFPGPLA